MSERASTELPAGTVTFMLTDIEGSTRRWEEHGPEMAAAVGRHYEILDAAVCAHGGVRPIEQGEGDSMVAAFARATDAVAAALAVQLGMAAEPWPDGVELAVRMALHTGEAQIRDEKYYAGPSIIRCARLRSLGHGGQVRAFAEGAALGLGEAAAYASRARGERKRPANGWAALTPTELEVAALAATGASNAQIGERLFISPTTAKTHLQHIYAKLGVANRAALAAEATSRGLGREGGGRGAEHSPDG